MSSEHVHDVLIIGGGAVGATLARALSRFHLDVVLLEREAEVAFGVSNVVNAAGLYADEVAAMAGVGGFTIRPRRGEEYLLDRRLAGLVDRPHLPVPHTHDQGRDRQPDGRRHDHGRPDRRDRRRQGRPHDTRRDRRQVFTAAQRSCRA
jgi:glycine/D-amino acid oxidase-like deaminating enzyme